MIVKRFEAVQIENRLEKDLLNLLNDELYVNAPYEISEDGKICSVKAIIKYLTDLGIDLSMYLDSKKYNI